MTALLAKIKTFVKDEEGLTVVEYAVAAALVAAALVVAFALLGENVERIISGLAGTLGAAASSAGY